MNITEASRKDISDVLRLASVSWAGKLEEPDFLARILTLDQMPSYQRGEQRENRMKNRDVEEVDDEPRPKYDLNELLKAGVTGKCVARLTPQT